ncbi:sporulation protein [Streptomyces sp. AK02-01A]|uniref:sporulation protein n=1 Tax=Streptomyces sp. AK02-01A TaxID=3028648 RepID=UPI0029B142B1|nr:sporulation protein [Streptomyces sp. AK02-01A]MDX3850276.1 sporulation protein [Streptomyces sp. AK02-01A]
MVFKKLLGALGVGGPSVDTVLHTSSAIPGGHLAGQVRLRGGTNDADIERITLDLVARVEAEGHDVESEGTVVFDRVTVGGGFRLAKDEERTVDFRTALPWETPVTQLRGQHLGVILGVRTELAVSGARDKGDLDPLQVEPLPVQEAILEAFGQLGYGFTSADLELGHIGHTGQRLPFYQEIELTPPSRYAGAVTEIEVTFLATADGMEVILEADKRGGLFSGGQDALTRFTVTHDQVTGTDWNAEVESWVRQLIGGRAGFHADAYGAPYGHDSAGHHGGKQHSGGQHRSGPGTGAVVAGVAAGVAVGVVGGMVAAEIVDEIGDAFEEDEDNGDNGDDGGDDGGED